MMIRSIVLLLLISVIVIDGLKISSLLIKKSIVSLVTGISISTISLPCLAASSPSTLSELLKQLDDNNVNKVVFRGIIPTSATVYLKNNEELEVPLPNDDPKSPSGPTQIIARVQHSIGVVCQQDLEDIFKTTSKRGNVKGVQPPMVLSGQSPYPTKL